MNPLLDQGQRDITQIPHSFQSVFYTLQEYHRSITDQPDNLRLERAFLSALRLQFKDIVDMNNSARLERQDAIPDAQQVEIQAVQAQEEVHHRQIALVQHSEIQQDIRECEHVLNIRRTELESQAFERQRELATAAAEMAFAEVMIYSAPIARDWVDQQLSLDSQSFEDRHHSVGNNAYVSGSLVSILG